MNKQDCMRQKIFCYLEDKIDVLSFLKLQKNKEREKILTQHSKNYDSFFVFLMDHEQDPLIKIKNTSAEEKVKVCYLPFSPLPFSSSIMSFF